MKKIGLLLLISGSSLVLNAQERTLSSGGDQIGTNGNISFSIGLIDFMHVDETMYSVSEGMQQPYEIFVLELSDNNQIKIEIDVFPNPFQHEIVVSIPEDFNIPLTAALRNEEGKLIWEGNISAQKNSIPLENLSIGTYLLQISNEAKGSRIYKLIKQ